jgi:transcriptional regulator with XRE-family HTH domain
MTEEQKARTIQGWRELRGLSREELADKSGIPAALIAQLEDAGEPFESGTSAGSRFSNRVYGALNEALGARAGFLVPTAALVDAPLGHWVLDGTALADLDADVAGFLIEHAEKIGLRVAVQTEHGILLKDYENVDSDDFQYIVDYHAREAEYAMKMVERMSDAIAQFQEHATDGQQELGEALEMRDGRWVPKPPVDSEAGE